VHIETDDVEPPLRGWLARELRRLITLGELGPLAVHVRVVDDAEMGRLHERYRGEAGTTDVLTFDLRDQPQEPIEGDVVVCLDEARRQAARRGHATRLEVLLYALHGLLHLAGEDDHDPAGFERMHRREDELLTAAGHGAVFRPGETAPAGPRPPTSPPASQGGPSDNSSGSGVRSRHGAGERNR